MLEQGRKRGRREEGRDGATIQVLSNCLGVLEQGEPTLCRMWHSKIIFCKVLYFDFNPDSSEDQAAAPSLPCQQGEGERVEIEKFVP